MSEPSDQLLPYNRFVSGITPSFNRLLACKFFYFLFFTETLLTFGSELVIIFLKFLYDRDPVRQLLEASDADDTIEIDLYAFSS